GIRDKLVTGVQTCALPISTRPLIPIETGLASAKACAGSWQVLQATVPSTDNRPSKNSFSPRAIFWEVCGLSAGTTARVASTGSRSEERRVGKEGRWWWRRE